MTGDLFGSAAKVLTVAELTRAIRGTLETRFGGVWVHGEISNYKLHPSGHQYFTLKDQRAQVSCVIFRNTLPPNSRPLADGAHVQVFGNISVFEARGQYQLSVQIVQERGAGLLQAKFEALKRKLEGEGLFDRTHKKSLPKFPKRIGIITSPSGAAIRDILNVLQRRAPNLQILISPVRVQGTGAAQEIAVALRELATPNEFFPPPDLIVITRGGGSIEDLWEFNEEIVARAIYESSVPIVSAVGHEIDFTIADFVADLRAPTPSAAAELIVPDTVEILRRIGELRVCLDRNLRNFITHTQTRLRFLSEKALAREPLQRLRDAQQRIDMARDSLGALVTQVVREKRSSFVAATNTLRARSPGRELVTCRMTIEKLKGRLIAQPPRTIDVARQRFVRVDAMLRLLSPAATLGRGYSVTTNAAGEILLDAEDVRSGARVKTQLAKGSFESEVCH